ncbi:hypothetical protein AX769_09250 [Frondihabitans sp. PAMC 28766]|uniref:ROK family protein n=1 Tax=Frondihabitans sp. PAMC 28766 TaxID=1795630 RepID=UPI00078D5C41|nr:ROK family protein [Frondihabitans sp. PAMC 28766]AMM20314.1 hypothetical protein AX769_09250 [Frondihabitans sp. PAMC 28766]
MTGSECWLGIDLGGTYIKWVQLGADGDTLASGRRPTPMTGQADVTEALADVVLARLSAGVHLAGVGIAVPGHLSEDRDSITLLPNVPGEWPGFPLADTIVARTGFDPVLLNDARAFALAEIEFGSAHGSDDVVFATIGTGVGGALAARGTVVTTRRDGFGEVGHTTVVIDGDLCGCGSLGCVEAYAGGAAVLSRAKARGVALELGVVTLAALGRLAESDSVAADVLDEAYDAFAIGIATSCALTGARLVVVGGAVAHELPGYLNRSRERLAERLGLLGPVEVRLAQLGPRAGALGAAVAARITARHRPLSSEPAAHTTLEHLV